VPPEPADHVLRGLHHFWQARLGGLVDLLDVSCTWASEDAGSTKFAVFPIWSVPPAG
jgi:hypothetical protein